MIGDGGVYELEDIVNGNYTARYQYEATPTLGWSNSARIRLGGSTGLSAFSITNGDANTIMTFVRASSNVGIGTLDPNEKFAVVGNIGIGTGINSKFITVAAPSGGMLVEGSVGIGTTTPVGGLAVMNGNVGIGTWVPGSNLQVNNTFSFQSENNIGSQGGAFTVNWLTGNKQKVTLTGSTSHTATFTAPTSGVSNLMLKVVQGSASNTVTWPAAVKWPSASTPALTTINGQEDLVNCYWDGADYLCTAALNYTP